MTKGKKHMDGTKSCRKRKLVYGACRADGGYRRVLSERRQGPALEDGELEYLDWLVSPKIRDGQSVHHICVTNAAKLHVAKVDPKEVALKPRLVGIEMK